MYKHDRTFSFILIKIKSIIIGFRFFYIVKTEVTEEYIVESDTYKRDEEIKVPFKRMQTEVKLQ
ncbi:hypothetical protein OFS06_03540 [Brachyspira hyodysenteriae]|uniref:hypothetical protein n=1 Tax=Brachyspira hyodysenteriae TaxID=159 RepID=UPI0022CD9887|nr:hypothetical protein [Brachyspira hyodysenteriae]MDA0101643.1 hypothetical protein [Brachyspira hyodysenteriae]